MRAAFLSLSMVFFVACGAKDEVVLPDVVDAAVALDADAPDVDAPDREADDAALTDAGFTDAEVMDAAAPDADTPDTGPADSGEHPDAAMAGPFSFATPAWMDGARVPPEYTCAGTGGWRNQRNPELVWSDPPAGTQAFVMIFDDPDARNYPHWAFYTADATLTGVPEGVSNTMNLPTGITELRGGDGRVGYVPNCPGGRDHTYRWRLWAVNTASLNLPARPTFTQLQQAADAASLGMVTFTGISNAR